MNARKAERLGVALIGVGFFAGIGAAVAAFMQFGWELALLALLVTWFFFINAAVIVTEPRITRGLLILLLYPAVCLSVCALAYWSGSARWLAAVLGLIFGTGLWILLNSALRSGSSGWVFIGFVVIVLLSAGVYYTYPRVPQEPTQVAVQDNPDAEARAQAFQSHVSDYSSASGIVNEVGKVDPYTTGKLIIFDVKALTFDFGEVYGTLPPDLRAGSPAEVGTIVWLECGEHVTGSYSDDAAAIQNFCVARIVDKARGALIAEKKFLGSAPPASKPWQPSVPGYGSSPTGQDVGEYLASLPRK